MDDEDIFALSKSSWNPHSSSNPRGSMKSKGGITNADNDFDNDSLAFSESGADFFRSRAFS